MKIFKSRRFRFLVVFFGPFAAIVFFMVAFGQGETVQNGSVPPGTVPVIELRVGTIPTATASSSTSGCSWTNSKAPTLEGRQVNEQFSTDVEWSNVNKNCRLQIEWTLTDTLHSVNHLRLFNISASTFSPSQYCFRNSAFTAVWCVWQAPAGTDLVDIYVEWQVVSAGSQFMQFDSLDSSNETHWAVTGNFVAPTPTPILVPTATPKPGGTPQAYIYLPVLERSEAAVSASGQVSTTVVLTK